MTTRTFKQLRAALNGKLPGVKIYSNCFYPTPRFKTGKFNVYFDLEKKEMQLEASLAKITQGHNVFGSNDLEPMCLEVIRIIYDYLGLKFTETEKQIIREVGIRLGRLDITCSFRFRSPETVSQVLEYLYEHFRAEGKAWSAYGRESIESLYNQQNSTRVTDKFYNKGIELKLNGRGIPTNVPEQKRILTMASSILRFEHTMRGKELAERGINYAHDWTTNRVKAVFGARFKQFNFQGVIRPQMRVEELVGLNDSCRTYYRLWAEGAKLNKYRKCRTLDRARKHLLEKYQVDIYRNAKTGCPISVSDLLDPCKASYAAPKWLVQSGGVFSLSRVN
jgi:hypothetical protein